MTRRRYSLLSLLLLIFILCYAVTVCLCKNIFVVPSNGAVSSGGDCLTRDSAHSSLHTALALSESNDIIILLPGDHYIDYPIVVSKNLSIVAERANLEGSSQPEVRVYPSSTLVFNNCSILQDKSSCTLFTIDNQVLEPLRLEISGLVFPQLGQVAILRAQWPSLPFARPDIVPIKINISDIDVAQFEGLVIILENGDERSLQATGVTVALHMNKARFHDATFVDYKVSSGSGIIVFSGDEARISDCLFTNLWTFSRVSFPNWHATISIQAKSVYLDSITFDSMDVKPLFAQASRIAASNATLSSITMSNVYSRTQSCYIVQLYSFQNMIARDIRIERVRIVDPVEYRLSGLLRFENMLNLELSNFVLDAPSMELASGLDFDMIRMINSGMIRGSNWKLDGRGVARCLLTENTESGLVLEGVIMQNCSSFTRGGAIRRLQDSYTIIKNSQFLNCRSKQGSGGALSLVLSDNVDLLDSSFVSCSSNANGGAIHMDSKTLMKGYTYPVLSLKRTVFTRNVAANFGGAVYAQDLQMYFDEGGNVFSQNRASSGGAVALFNTPAGDSDWSRYVKPSTLYTQNTARMAGGAFLVSFDPECQFGVDKDVWLASAPIPHRFLQNFAGSGNGNDMAFLRMPFTQAELVKFRRLYAAQPDMSISAQLASVKVFFKGNLEIKEGAMFDVQPSQPFSLSFLPQDTYGQVLQEPSLQAVTAIVRAGESERQVSVGLFNPNAEVTITMQNTTIGSLVEPRVELVGSLFGEQIVTIPKFQFRVVGCPPASVEIDGTKCQSIVVQIVILAVSAAVALVLVALLLIAVIAVFVQTMAKRKQAMLVKKLVGNGDKAAFMPLLEEESNEGGEVNDLIKELPPGMLIQKKDVQIVDQLGGGAQALVFTGIIYGSTPVALKMFAKKQFMQQDGEADDALQEFVTECKLLARFGTHINIVRFLGIADIGKQVAMVTELMRGSLASLLARHNVTKTREEEWALPLEVKVRLLCGIASGLTYLHSHSVLHRDVKPENVLVNEGEWDRPVLCDLAMSKHIDAGNQSQHTLTIGTVTYVAPEVIGVDSTQKQGSYNDRIDVYSFAILMCVILTEQLRPYGNMSDMDLMWRVKGQNQRPNLDDQQQYVECQRKCELEHLGQNKTNQSILALQRMFVLMRDCWAQSPTDRPSMKVVLQELESIKKTVM